MREVFDGAKHGAVAHAPATGGGTFTEERESTGCARSMAV
jgi:hypothetical protein